MRQKMLLAFAAGAMLASCGESENAEGPEVADLLFSGGTVYTVDGDATVAEAIAVRGDKILYVGSAEGAKAYVGPNTLTEDISGKIVFPGFTDSHAHLPDGGDTILGLGLGGLTSAEQIVHAVKAYADAHPELPAIMGSGWELNLFPDANPNKALLDEIVPDRPVMLVAADGHNGWVNTRALDLAGVTSETADPVNGRIERDAEGNPTGTLRESAQGLVSHIFPKPAVEDVVRNLEAGLAYQAGNGITATIDAAIMHDHNEAAYLEVSSRQDLPQRVRLSLLAAEEMVTSMVTPDNVEAVVEKLVERRAQFRAQAKDRLDADAVKIFVDGVPENHTAAMLEPYVNAPLGPDHRGEINLSEEALNAYAIALENAGFQIHIHAIGDRAVRVSLNALEGAIETNGERPRRHHLSHLEIVQPEDIQRFAPLGVTANLQALWHFNDAYISELTEPFLQEKLHRWIYPAKSFVNAGARVVWGSDWPVSTSDPFDSMEVAVLRKNPDDANDQSWIPEERLSVDDMIKALTINGAYLMGQEDIRGSLEVGKQADFILVDADPYKVLPEDISDIRVLRTYIGGRQVFSAAE
ncbi:MAG: amidohydrolase [Alphaproteobacteria bacterium]|nr:amidohydrolase [Alphaproteobacteria bacterium]